MSTFVDTSAIYAVLSSTDENHATASAVWAALVGDGDDLYTSNYVVTETCALLMNRLGPAAVLAFADNVLPLMTVSWVGRTVHEAALRATCVGSRSGPSMVDRTSFALVRDLGAASVFAFDQHFAAEGFTVLGRP